VTSVHPHANTGTCVTMKASNFAVGAVLELFIEGQWKLISNGTSITTRITSPSKRACPGHRRGWFMKRHSVHQETSSPPLPSRTHSRLSQDCVLQCNTTMAACLVPVRRLLRPSRSMHFGDVSETNGQETPRQSRGAHARAFLHF